MFNNFGIIEGIGRKYPKASRSSGNTGSLGRLLVNRRNIVEVSDKRKRSNV